MYYGKNEKIGNSYTVLFPHKESGNVESYRVKDEHGRTVFVQILKHTDSTELYRQCAGKTGLPVYLDEGTTETNDGKKTFVVTRFISSQTLGEYIHQNRIIKPEQALSVASDIISAISSLHTFGYFHTAISDDNIQIPLSDEDTSALVTGLSRVCKDGDSHMSVPLAEEGNLTQAPEYFHGNFTERSEVYAIGALLYEMCFGIKLWDLDLNIIPEEQRTLLLLKAKRKPIEIPCLSTSQPDSNITDIILKATSYKEEDRYSSLEELQQVITSLLSDIDKEEKKPKDIHQLHGNGFKDVVGMDELKERIQREVIDILRDPEGAKEFGINIPNGILLYGPPGCGKTFFAEKMAEEIGCHFMCVHCSDVASPYIHGGQDKIAAIFEEARSKAPTLLFLDEVDSLLMKRSKQTNVSESGEVNEFLCQLNNCGKSNVIVVAATNRGDDIDEAAIRAGRLETKYFVGPPDENAIAEIFRIYLSKTKSVVSDYRSAARKMNGHSPADVKLVVDTAARAAFHKKTPIDTAILDDAISTVLAKTVNPQRKKIGF